MTKIVVSYQEGLEVHLQFLVAVIEEPLEEQVGGKIEVVVK